MHTYIILFKSYNLLQLLQNIHRTYTHTTKKTYTLKKTKNIHIFIDYNLIWIQNKQNENKDGSPIDSSKLINKLIIRLHYIYYKLRLKQWMASFVYVLAKDRNKEVQNSYNLFFIVFGVKLYSRIRFDLI